jgi:UDP-glucuronate decarboxylase
MKIRVISKPTIVLTGASGWLGRSTLQVMIDLFGVDILDSLQCYGSKDSVLHLSNDVDVEIFSLDKLLSNDCEIDLFIPHAFLTREKYFEKGPKCFWDDNMKIIQHEQELILRNQVRSTVLISSGIVTTIGEQKFKDESFVLYSRLKKLEEILISQASANMGSNLITCRLFSATGVDMPNPAQYAIGNFVQQVLTTGNINIESSRPVFRKYVDSRQLMRCCIQLAQNGKTLSFESSGILMELSDLARQILSTLNTEGVVSTPNLEDNIEPDNYFSSSSIMDQLFDECGINLLKIEAQILNVAQAVNVYNSHNMAPS